MLRQRWMPAPTQGHLRRGPAIRRLPPLRHLVTGPSSSLPCRLASSSLLAYERPLRTRTRLADSLRLPLLSRASPSAYHFVRGLRHRLATLGCVLPFLPRQHSVEERVRRCRRQLPGPVPTPEPLRHDLGDSTRDALDERLSPRGHDTPSAIVPHNSGTSTGTPSDPIPRLRPRHPRHALCERGLHPMSRPRRPPRCRGSEIRQKPCHHWTVALVADVQGEGARAGTCPTRQ